MTFTVSKIVSDETLDCIIHIESRGNPNAKAPTSSATGMFQFLNATWQAVVRKHRPDVYESTAMPVLLAMRRDPKFCIEIGARFTEDNLKAIGMDATGGDLYLAHFLGVGDARDFFRADPSTPVANLVKPEVIKANENILRNKTAGQVRAWAAKKMFEARGHGYIAKYFPAPLPEPEPEPAPDEPKADDYPDPQDAPAAPVPPESHPRPDPAPDRAPPDPTQITPAKKESFWEWIDRKRKTVWGSVSGIMGGGGILTYFTDWRVLAVLVSGLIIGVSVIYAFWLLSRPK